MEKPKLSKKQKNLTEQIKRETRIKRGKLEFTLRETYNFDVFSKLNLVPESLLGAIVVGGYQTLSTSGRIFIKEIYDIKFGNLVFRYASDKKGFREKERRIIEQCLDYNPISIRKSKFIRD